MKLISLLPLALGCPLIEVILDLRRMFMENVPTFKFNGLAWLFLGMANSDSLLYGDEFTKYLEEHPDNFRYDRALSREQKNMSGGRITPMIKSKSTMMKFSKYWIMGHTFTSVGLKG